MNYIRHLTAFFEKVADDERINPFHISLYMALFQLWNIQRFENPISIARAELMKLSRIGSTHTYYKCLNELNIWAYIIYEPSKSNLIASTISLCTFDTSNAQAVHQVSSKSDTSATQAVHPYNKHNINIINKTYSEGQTQNEDSILNSENIKTEDPMERISKRKKVAPKKVEGIDRNPAKSGKNQFQKPILDEVIAFFKAEGYPEVEASKFFNHFESNGWKVGGKSPMKNWQAAARNWMLNSQRFEAPQSFPNPQLKPKPDPNNKNYGEPLNRPLKMALRKQQGCTIGEAVKKNSFSTVCRSSAVEERDGARSHSQAFFFVFSLAHFQILKFSNFLFYD
jgi:hypothetical protein